MKKRGTFFTRNIDKTWGRLWKRGVKEKEKRPGIPKHCGAKGEKRIKIDPRG